MRQEEPEPVYRELVDALADNVVPMAILCATMAAAGTYVWSIRPDPLTTAASLLCTATTFVKIVTILHHRHHRAAYRDAALDRVRWHEFVHFVTTVAVCLSIGLFSVAVYALPYPVLHLLPIAITFGYSGGLIARASVRPHIAGIAILCLIVPNMLAQMLSGEHHLFIALILMVFAAAGLQSVAFVYDTARRAVMLRLELEQLARRDPLTGLLNRLALREAFEALASGVRQPVVVHAFDLDGFKGVNDRFGHLAGDRLLALLAARIQSSIRDDTIAARIGGDEFVMVQLGDEAAAWCLARRIHDQLTRPCDVGQAEPVSVGLSLGYAVGQLPDVSLEALIQQADARSYAVKRAGGGIRGPEALVDEPAITFVPVEVLNCPV